MNCTHQFDLAGLCVSHAARGRRRRASTTSSSLRRVDGTVTTRLWRDGELTLEWQLAVGATRTRELVSPPPFTEAPWRGGFMKWADATFPPEEAEAAIVLRRSCDIGMGRGMDLEAIPVAAGARRDHDRHLLLDAARGHARRVPEQGLDPRLRRAPGRAAARRAGARRDGATPATGLICTRAVNTGAAPRSASVCPVSALTPGPRRTSPCHQLSRTTTVPSSTVVGDRRVELQRAVLVA